MPSCVDRSDALLLALLALSELLIGWIYADPTRLAWAIVLLMMYHQLLKPWIMRTCCGVLEMLDAAGEECGVDHIVFNCDSLDKGIANIEALTGVRAAYGGSHPGVGTHNALLSLGDSCYLEIIAPDPEQPTPAQPLPFRLDDKKTHDKLVAFAVHPEGSTTLEMLATTMRQLGSDPGTIGEMSRNRPDGKMLRWRMSTLALARGSRPWLIDWGRLPSPAATSPAGCRLLCLRCYGAGREPGVMGRALEAMGLQRLSASGKAVEFHGQAVNWKGEVGMAAVDKDAKVRALQDGHFLVAELETPRGVIQLGLE